MPRKAKDEEIKKDNKKKVSKENKPKSPKMTVEVEKKSTSIKKASDKKSEVTKVATKKASSKKKATSKSTTKTAPKKTTKKSTSTKKPIALTEYYDLPGAYNRTIVKILAQTPASLFVYWEISEDDKIKLKKEYGEEFFSNTKPYLIITNETMSYSFEVEINDYANSWYIHINDSDCKYSLQLIRKSINPSLSLPSSFVNITSSNKISAPNDHILFDKLGKTIFFRNVKSDIITKKDISSFSFISNIGRIYNIYDIYKEIYKNELNGDELGIRLSSSQFSSTFQ